MLHTAGKAENIIKTAEHFFISNRRFLLSLKAGKHPVTFFDKFYIMLLSAGFNPSGSFCRGRSTAFRAKLAFEPGSALITIHV